MNVSRKIKGNTFCANIIDSLIFCKIYLIVVSVRKVKKQSFDVFVFMTAYFNFTAGHTVTLVGDRRITTCELFIAVKAKDTLARKLVELNLSLE